MGPGFGKWQAEGCGWGEDLRPPKQQICQVPALLLPPTSKGRRAGAVIQHDQIAAGTARVKARVHDKVSSSVTPGVMADCNSGHKNEQRLD